MIDETKTTPQKPTIALLSLTQLPRNRATFTIPADEPLVLALSTITHDRGFDREGNHLGLADEPTEVGLKNLAEIEADLYVLKIRSDAPVTRNVRRFAPVVDAISPQARA